MAHIFSFINAKQKSTNAINCNVSMHTHPANSPRTNCFAVAFSAKK